MIGLLLVQVLRTAGVGRMVAIDLDEAKLALALRLGADQVFNATSPTLVENIRELTNGRGADIAIDAVGSSPSLQTAIAGVRKGGTVTLVGNIAQNVELPLQSVVTRQIKLIGSCASAGEYPECIHL